LKNLNIITNERIFYYESNFFSENIDCSSIVDGLSKNFAIKVFARSSYKIEKNMIVWLSMESTQRVLFRQRRISICNSIPSRQNNFVPSRYPGTATSYKWALLNDDRIWLL